MISSTALQGISDIDLSALANYADLVARILQDPYLNQTMTLAQEAADAATGPSGAHPGQPGVGLKGAIFPLKAFIFVQKNPWFPYVAVSGALLLPFAVGVLVGRRKNGG